MRTIRLGDLLVKHGVLTEKQRDHVLNAQKLRAKPFGALAEELFGVDPDQVEKAWAEQFAALSVPIDPRAYHVNPEVLGLVERRQAWQFRILPLRMDGAEVMICTAKEHLPRALRFAYSRFGPGCYFVLAEPDHLGQALERHYPMPGARDELAAWHAGRHAAGT